LARFQLRAELRTFTVRICPKSFARLSRNGNHGKIDLRAETTICGGVHDTDGGGTWCAGCGELLIERDWYELGEWNLENGRCRSCGYQIAGRFEEQRGNWGRRRVPVKLN